MSASTVTGVELGFVETLDEKWKLLSHFFPSKVGGKPAWLCLKPVPSVNEITCGKCAKPCVFLLQVYAPIVDKNHCFHRTIFLFICRDPQCNKRNSNQNWIALRSQLCRENEFYNSEPPDESCFNDQSDYPKPENYQPLCRVCGCSGPKTCAKCHQASYCSKEHQTIDWKAEHKQNCSTSSDGMLSEKARLVVLNIGWTFDGPPDIRE
jgi:pre-rRNA-processing protein TSR4